MSEQLRELIDLERRCASLRQSLGLEHELVPPPVGVNAEEAALALLAAHAAELLSVHAGDGTYLWVSGSCERKFGHRPEELVGRSAYEFFHPEDLERISANHAEHVDEAEASCIEYRFRQGDGSYCWVETHSSNSKTSQGLPQIVCLTRDVSERREREQKAQQLLAKYERALARAAEKDEQLLRMCAWCHAISDADDEWQAITQFLSEVLQRPLTHGICPACVAELRSPSTTGVADP